MQNNLVSIALTTYNGEKYLKEQLDSIYNQTYKNIEVVVTDDCSCDKTIDILEEYKQNQGLKYYINTQNLGFVKNFERAISLCRGDFIALADQDDIWLPEKIETLVNEIQNHSLIYSDASLIDADGNLIAESFQRSSDWLANNDTSFLQLFFRKFVYGCTILFKKEAVEKAIPIPSEIFTHDWWLPVVSSKINGIKYLDRSLILYRQHAKNQIGASENFSLPYKIIRYFFSTEQRNTRNLRRFKRKRLITEALKEDIALTYTEKISLEEVVYYYERFLNKKLDFQSIKIAYKHNNLLYDKKFYFFLDILGYYLHKA